MLATMADEHRSKLERERWTQTDELIAALIEEVRLGRIEAMALGGVKQSKLPEFHRVPRPYDEPKKKGGGMTVRNLARRMLGMGGGQSG